MTVFMVLGLVLFAIGILIVTATQVAVPLYYGTPLFPFFRRSEISEKISEAAQELETVAELEQLDKLQDEINRRRAQLKEDDNER